MAEHQLNLPWRFEGRTLYDSTGVPVAVTLDYTSVARKEAYGTVYHTSEYAGPLRADAICRAMSEGK